MASSARGFVAAPPGERQTAGAAWLFEKVYVAAGFEMVFRFQITDGCGVDHGADGLAFVLQAAEIRMSETPIAGPRAEVAVSDKRQDCSSVADQHAVLGSVSMGKYVAGWIPEAWGVFRGSTVVEGVSQVRRRSTGNPA